MKSSVQNNDIEIYSKHEEKSVVAEKFIRKFIRNLRIYDCNIKKCIYCMIMIHVSKSA